MHCLQWKYIIFDKSDRKPSSEFYFLWKNRALSLVSIRVGIDNALLSFYYNWRQSSSRERDFFKLYKTSFLWFPLFNFLYNLWPLCLLLVTCFRFIWKFLLEFFFFQQRLHHFCSHQQGIIINIPLVEIVHCFCIELAAFYHSKSFLTEIHLQ